MFALYLDGESLENFKDVLNHDDAEDCIQIGRFEVVKVWGLLEGVFATDGNRDIYLTDNPRSDYTAEELEDIFKIFSDRG